MKNPVILIPGIQGTKLVDSNKENHDVVWSGIQKYFENLYDLELLPDGDTDKKREVVIERRDVEDKAYSEILNYLDNAGYPVYIFGYDWRKSNLENGQKLYDFVRIVRRKNRGHAQLNFITHSMGCLVFSGFFKLLTDYQKDKFIRKVVLIPHIIRVQFNGLLERKQSVFMITQLAQG